MVVLPLAQWIVPPVVNVVIESPVAFPPVTPPVHPLTVRTVVPLIVVHSIFAPANAGGASAKVAPATGMIRAAVKSNARRTLPPLFRWMFSVAWEASLRRHPPRAD